MNARTKVPIVRRRVNIPFDTADAPGWIPAEKDIENFLNAISFGFPPGEKFFIQSVQFYMDRIDDPVLKEQVKAFIFQEAMHSKEHSRANARLVESFPPGPEIEKAFSRPLATVTRYAPRSTQLAITCALEHFTAVLAHELLIWQEGFIKKSDPAFAAMWLWHAVEEAEHKAVCFDVYQKVCGRGVISYLNRIGAMLIATVMFANSTRVAMRALRTTQRAKTDGADAANAPARADGTVSPNESEKASGGRRNALRVLAEILPFRMYFEYFRPSFHPWDIDDSDLIAAWKTKYKDFSAIEDIEHGQARA